MLGPGQPERMAPPGAPLVASAASVEAMEQRLGTLAAANEDLHRQMADRDRRELEREQSPFETAFTRAPIGMALLAMDGRWLQVNDAFCRIVGHLREDLEKTTLHAMAHPEDGDLDGSLGRDLLAGAIPSYQVEKRLRHARGHYRWVLLTHSLVRDRQEKPLYLVTQAQDIAYSKEQASRVEYLIDHDVLTGLLNRRRFLREVASETERMSRHGTKGAVLMIDLDNFKTVNDTFGHKAGDDLLRGVAATLRQNRRHTDVLARVGGDEFALLLADTDADQAQIVAQGIVGVLRQQVAVLGDETIHLSVSVGIAHCDGLRAIEVLELADLAMYEAKEGGRNRVATYRPWGEHPGQASRRSEVERIRTALAEDRMLLYCQPILDLRNGEVCQYELLLRLQDDTSSEPLLPSAFLYVAERFNLIQEIDCWVARQAIELIAAHARAGRSLVLHVNLSGKSIGDPSVAACIDQAIAESAIDPSCLVFELTETTAITNIEEAKVFADRLRIRGCRFALDDFGAGFGSFSYLKSLPFDYLKIDGDFIRHCAASPMDQLVVRAIVGIARGMGQKTIAEFVPDEDTRRLLQEIGIDYAQGQYVGPAGPFREILFPRPQGDPCTGPWP